MRLMDRKQRMDHDISVPGQERGPSPIVACLDRWSPSPSNLRKSLRLLVSLGAELLDFAWLAWPPATQNPKNPRLGSRGLSLLFQGLATLHSNAKSSVLAGSRSNRFLKFVMVS